MYDPLFFAWAATHINTGGGGAVTGDANTNGGDFVARDQISVSLGGNKRPEPESLSNREIFERLYRLESDAKDDRFRIQVALAGIVVLIIALAILAAVWFSGRFEDVDTRFGRIEARLNGMERRLHRMFPEDFPYAPPYYYGSLAEPNSAELVVIDKKE